MIEAHEVAERHASSKPGFRLLACEPAALPFFAITGPAVLQQRKPIPPIDEFILRAIQLGIGNPDGIAEFLGLDEPLVNRSLARLWQADLVDFPAVEGARALRLTLAGTRAIEQLTELSPEETDIWFTFDRLTWRPAEIHSAQLIQPKDARNLDLIQISPKKQARPEADELSLPAVGRALKASMRGNLGDSDLLVFKRVDRGEQKYLPCHLLVYESADGSDHAFEVAIDGRLSTEATAAIDALGGITHLKLQFDKPAEKDRQEIAPVQAAISSSPAPVASLAKVDAVRTASARAEGVDDVAATPERDPITGRQPQLDALEARNLDTFEHPGYLLEAMQTATRRLLLTSPWVRNAVVNDQFIGHLRRLAKRGIKIHIGYGITPDAKDCDSNALRRLMSLQREAPNQVKVGCLGDTHAKILIWDDHQIVTSFNWLSFRGDQDRTYRQETGVLLKNNRAGVDALYEEQRKAIEKVAGPS